MNPTVFRLALLVAASAVGAGLWWASSGQDPVDAPEAASGASAIVVQRVATTATRNAPTGRAPTTIEEAARLLELGAAGDLSVDMHTRSALDVLLASLGPEATPEAFQKLEEALRRSMPGEAATQAIALVRRYDAYHRAADGLAAQQAAPSTLEELKALQEKTLALRRQHFDEVTARALFGAEEEQTRIDMAMNAIQADTSLSEQEKAARIGALRESTPRDLPGLQVPVSASFADMERQVATLRQQGATPAQIEQVRTRHLGSEAAKALTEMEAQRDEWELRYQAYAQQKKAIVAAAAPDMAAQLDAVLRRHFQPEELEAARAYERHRSP